MLVMKLGAEKKTPLPRSCRYRVGTWAWTPRAHACSPAVPPARTAPSGADSGLRMQLRRPLKPAGMDAAGVDLRTSTVLSPWTRGGNVPGLLSPQGGHMPRKELVSPGLARAAVGLTHGPPGAWQGGVCFPGDPGWARGSGSQGRRPGEAVAWEGDVLCSITSQGWT